MDVQITIRRGRAGATFREMAAEKVRKLAKYEPRLLRVELFFDEDRGRVQGELRAVVPGVPTLVARADADSRRTALDRVIQKAARQLRRARAKRVEHQAPPLAGAVE